MSPLELKVFPPIPECPQPHWGSFAYEDWFTDRAAEMKLRERKRLTDSELAAEYWELTYGSEVASGWASDYAIILQSNERRETMRRFATLPNYDEES